VPDSAGFVQDTEPFRRELLAHCYRMLGSIQDAEDLVQETYLRAWRSYGGFEGRSSIRTWLYRIATNACLTELARHSRRVLPSGLYDPEPDPGAYPEEAGTDVNWLQPLPDAMVTPDSADPAIIIAAREGLRLALMERLLTEDVTIEATPMRTWFAGRKTCIPFLRHHTLGSPGDWRMLATSANGQPAVTAYTRDQNGHYQPYGICVLTVTDAGVSRISSFGDPGLVTVFGFWPDMAQPKDAESASSGA
jgi:RNA polymerase sigma factor (sigma-70 family)